MTAKGIGGNGVTLHRLASAAGRPVSPETTRPDRGEATGVAVALHPGALGPRAIQKQRAT